MQQNHNYFAKNYFIETDNHNAVKSFLLSQDTPYCNETIISVPKLIMFHRKNCGEPFVQ